MPSSPSAPSGIRCLGGQPIAVPSQDVVLGCYYLTKEKRDAKGAGRAFSCFEDVLFALAQGEVETLAPIRLQYTGELIDLTTMDDDQDVVRAEVQHIKNKVINTTVGRVILADHLEGIPFVNGLLKKRGLQQLVQYVYLRYGLEKTVHTLDAVKDLGFRHATKAGISISITDLVIPEVKEQIVSQGHKDVLAVEKQYLDGAITNGERYNKVIAIWTDATENVADAMFKSMQGQDKVGNFNPIYIMADSGARGSKQQLRQLAGMRGLMARPSGEIIENPITNNFREGLTVLQYFISTHGARKGLADTALKTADSGYLTRRLVDVSQDVIISEYDCGTTEGIEIRSIIESGEVIEPLRDRIIGRVSVHDVRDPFGGSVIVAANEEVTEDKATHVDASGVDHIRIRSVLTCASARGVCALCYGRDLATGKIVEIGMAVGVIAAQSIGEPGTQLTMRTFHVGGAASLRSEQSTVEAKHAGVIAFQGLSTVKNKKGESIVMNRGGWMIVADSKGRERERHQIVYGAKLKVKEGQEVEVAQQLVEWDPFSFSILTEEAGVVNFKDILDKQTVAEHVDENTGLSALVIMDSPDEKKQPRIEIKNDEGKSKRRYLLPSGSHLMVQDGQTVDAGDVLVKIPRETAKQKDITGGLPRVVELFEARRPKEPAVITEVNGLVKFGDVTKSHRKVMVVTPDGEEHEYQLPRGAHVNVREGEAVVAGDPLMDGPIDPHDILKVKGADELQRYLVDEIQEVYRLQGVAINDKHIEVIGRQMMRWVKIEEVGDSDFLVDEVVDFYRFMRENAKLEAAGKAPAGAKRILLGITKASLSTDSFISAASFQETTRVLTEAAISGRVDHLRGLKENVIMGRLIPAGTGMPYYQRVEIPEEVYEAREETFDQDYKPDFAAGEEVVTGGTYGADS